MDWGCLCLFIWQTLHLMFSLAGVKIDDMVTVSVSSSAQNATLPCNFSTSYPFNVRWTQNDTKGPVVLTKEFSGKVIPGDSFEGRVNVTGKASLVLSMPKVSDSSIYTCSVTVPKDVIDSDSESVQLVVTDEEKGVPSGTCDHYMPVVTSLLTASVVYCMHLSVCP